MFLVSCLCSTSVVKSHGVQPNQSLAVMLLCWFHCSSIAFQAALRVDPLVYYCYAVFAEVWEDWRRDWIASKQTEEHWRRNSFCWSEDKDGKIAREEDSNNCRTREIKVNFASTYNSLSSCLFSLNILLHLSNFVHQTMQNTWEPGMGIYAAKQFWNGWTVLQVNPFIDRNFLAIYVWLYHTL